MRAPRLIETLVRDVQFGLRQAARAPGLTAVIVLSLALGIGANTALFSVVNAVMLRGAGVADPSTLVAFGVPRSGQVPDEIMKGQSGYQKDGPGGQPLGLTFPWQSFTHIRSRTRAFSDVAGFVPIGMFIKPSAVVRGQPMVVDGEMVTDRFFETLGVGASAGRLIGAEDQKPDAPRVGVISHGFWTRAFGRDRSAVGSTIMVNNVPVTIVGIVERGFAGLMTGQPPDIWIPITLQGALTPWGVPTKTPEVDFRKPTRWWLQVAGRLKPGVTRDRAQAEASRLLRESFADVAPDALLAKVPPIVLMPGATGFNVLASRFSTPFAALAAGAGIVLLVACANVATLLLTRATARRKEMSVRLAMGASRGRLFRQLLTEHAMYGVAGTILAIAFAWWTGPILLVLLSTTPTRDALPIDVALDLRVLAFTAVVSLATTLLFGLVPAARAARAGIVGAIKEGAGGSTRDIRLGRLTLGRLFVAAQIAMTLPLVLGAGLFLRTLSNLQNERLGFDREKILLFSVDGTKAGYEDASLSRAYENLRQALETIPGVRAAAFSRFSLVSGWTNNSRITVEGGEAPAPGARQVDVHYNEVAPGFTETMGMPVVIGRPLGKHDLAGTVRVAVITETMARTFFPGGSPIGRRFYQGRPRTTMADAITVVGVVKDVKFQTVRAPAPPAYFMPYTQANYPMSGMKFEVRTAGDPLAIVTQVREIAGRIIPGVPVGDVKTQDAQVEQSLGMEHMFARLFTFFGITALALACLGLHGTMAYALRRRTRELGIRAALGAGRPALMRMALGETLVVALAGLGAGAMLAAGGARLVRTLLFGVTPLDPSTIAWVTALMLAVAVAAGYVPARRACRVDPMSALREE